MLHCIIYMLKLKRLLIKLSIFSPPALESLDSPASEVFKALSTNYCRGRAKHRQQTPH